MSRAEILKRIEQLNQVDSNINLKYSKIASKKKSELIDILNELEKEDACDEEL